MKSDYPESYFRLTLIKRETKIENFLLNLLSTNNKKFNELTGSVTYDFEENEIVENQLRVSKYLEIFVDNI